MLNAVTANSHSTAAGRLRARKEVERMPPVDGNDGDVVVVVTMVWYDDDDDDDGGGNGSVRG